MKHQDLASSARRADRQHATFSLRIGKRARMDAAVTVTDRGLLTIGALVSSILLSSAAIVWVARRRPAPRAELTRR